MSRGFESHLWWLSYSHRPKKLYSSLNHRKIKSNKDRIDLKTKQKINRIIVKTAIKIRSAYYAHQNNSIEYLLCFQSSNRFYLCNFLFYVDSKRCKVCFAGDCITICCFTRIMVFIQLCSNKIEYLTLSI